jgi:hypothetical protein
MPAFVLGLPGERVRGDDCRIGHERTLVDDKVAVNLMDKVDVC